MIRDAFSMTQRKRHKGSCVIGNAYVSGYNQSEEQLPDVRLNAEPAGEPSAVFSNGDHVHSWQQADCWDTRAIFVLDNNCRKIFGINSSEFEISGVNDQGITTPILHFLAPCCNWLTEFEVNVFTRRRKNVLAGAYVRVLLKFVFISLVNVDWFLKC